MSRIGFGIAYLWSLASYVSVLTTMLMAVVYLYSNGFIASQDSQQDVAEPSIDWDNIKFNVGLLGLFFLQHTVMSRRWFKELYHRGAPLEHPVLASLERSTFTFCTAVCLQALIQYYRPLVPGYNLVSLSSASHPRLYMALSAVHFLSWISVAASAIALDHLDLLGPKQVYYLSIGHSLPNEYKSERAQTLFARFRHPIVIAPLLILLAVPTLSADRALMALSFLLYSVVGSALEMEDVHYVGEQLGNKRNQLTSNL